MAGHVVHFLMPGSNATACAATPGHAFTRTPDKVTCKRCRRQVRLGIQLPLYGETTES